MGILFFFPLCVFNRKFETKKTEIVVDFKQSSSDHSGTSHLREGAAEWGVEAEEDWRDWRNVDVSFLDVFLPPALSKGKLKDDLTLMSFD